MVDRLGSLASSRVFRATFADGGGVAGRPRESQQIVPTRPPVLEAARLQGLSATLRNILRPSRLGKLGWLQDPNKESPPREVEDISIERGYIAALALSRRRDNPNLLKYPGNIAIAFVAFPKMLVEPQWEMVVSDPPRRLVTNSAEVYPELTGLQETAVIANLEEASGSWRETIDLVRSLREGAALVYRQWLQNPDESLPGLAYFHTWTREEYPDLNSEQVLQILSGEASILRIKGLVTDRTAGYFPPMPTADTEFRVGIPAEEISLDAPHVFPHKRTAMKENKRLSDTDEAKRELVASGVAVDRLYGPAAGDTRKGRRRRSQSVKASEVMPGSRAGYGLSRKVATSDQPREVGEQVGQTALISFRGREQELVGYFTQLNDQGERVYGSSRSVAEAMFPETGGDVGSQATVSRLRAEVLRKLEQPRERWGPDVSALVAGLIASGKFGTIEQIIGTIKINGTRAKSDAKALAPISGREDKRIDLDRRTVPTLAETNIGAVLGGKGVGSGFGVDRISITDEVEVLKRLRHFFSGQQIEYVSRVTTLDPDNDDFIYAEIREVSLDTGIPESDLTKAASSLSGYLRDEVRMEENSGREVDEAAGLLLDWVRSRDERFALLTNREVISLIDMQLGISDIEVIASQRKTTASESVRPTIPQPLATNQAPRSETVVDSTGVNATRADGVKLAEGELEDRKKASSSEIPPKLAPVTLKQRTTLEPFFDVDSGGIAIKRTLAEIAEIAYAVELALIIDPDLRQKRVASAMAAISLNRSQFINRAGQALQSPDLMHPTMRQFLDDVKVKAGLAEDQEAIDMLKATKTYKPRTRQI